MMDGMGLCMWSCLCCVSSRPRKTAPGAGLRCRIRTRKRCWLLPAQSPGPASLLLALSMVVAVAGERAVSGTGMGLSERHLAAALCCLASLIITGDPGILLPDPFKD